MSYPILAPRDTWFTQGNPSVAKDQIGNIAVFDTLDLTSPPYNNMESWDASAALDGSIHCVIVPGANALGIVGNGSGKISMNPDSHQVFYGFNSTPKITHTHLFDTSLVENFSYAFAVNGVAAQNSTALTHLDVSTWDVSACTNMSNMFVGNKYLTELDVSNWDVSKVKSLNFTFAFCNAVKKLDVSKWDVSNCKNFQGTFAYCSEVEELDVSNWQIKLYEDLSIAYTFSNCQKLKKIDLRSWPLHKALSISSLWSSCSSVTELLLPDNYLAGKTSAQAIFRNMTALTTLNTSNWDTSTVENMSFMFYGCTGLKEIDVSNWDVSKVKNFDHFAAYAGLVRKGIENWDTSSATNMNAMFHNCGEEELDLSGFDTSKVNFFSQMFEASTNLKRIKGLDKWDTSNATGFDEMFSGCYALEELDLSSFDTRKACNGVTGSSNGHTTGTLRNFCNDCQNLKWVKIGENFSVNGDGTNTTEEYKLVFPTPSTDYIDGADGMWYTINGESYSPTDIPDKTANTYYSSYGVVADMDVIVKNRDLLNAAQAIREKNGTTNRYMPSEFGEAILAL